jgi:hypothetical protein
VWLEREDGRVELLDLAGPSPEIQLHDEQVGQLRILTFRREAEPRQGKPWYRFAGARVVLR